MKVLMRTKSESVEDVYWLHRPEQRKKVQKRRRSESVEEGYNA